MHSTQQWLEQTSKRNHDEQFRQKSVAQLKNLEHLINRRIANDQHVRKNTNERFDDTLALINSLLDNVQLEISDQLSPDIKGRENRNLRTDE